MTEPPPTFGQVPPGARSRPRRAAYAVIRDTQARVATVGHGRHRFLPGGGSHARETVADTVVREVQEELGCQVLIREPIGAAVQHFFSSDDDCRYSMEADFVRAELPAGASASRFAAVAWLPQAEAVAAMFHASHVWALQA